MLGILARISIAPALLLTAAAAACALGGTPTAQAAIVPVAARPVVVVVDEPLENFTATVISTSSGTARRRLVAVSAPGALAVGTAVGAGAVEVRVSGVVHSREIVAGAQTGSAIESTGSETVASDVPVTFLRASRIVSAGVAAQGPGLAYVVAQVRHYRQVSDSWGPSRLSPVRLEYLESGRWVVAGTVTTDRHGLASGVVRVPRGDLLVRLVRPQGATVSRTVSEIQPFSS